MCNGIAVSGDLTLQLSK